ncbi:MAG TPA: hypothetical protein VK879_14415 [Candidatus Sulfomarinibacteraceae bacterium]|nr:hypothetical protein [Candidatus Sulfomarinibacteraceae bacterium]
MGGAYFFPHVIFGCSHTLLRFPPPEKAGDQRQEGEDGQPQPAAA